MDQDHFDADPDHFDGDPDYFDADPDHVEADLDHLLRIRIILMLNIYLVFIEKSFMAHHDLHNVKN